MFSCDSKVIKALYSTIIEASCAWFCDLFLVDLYVFFVLIFHQIREFVLAVISIHVTCVIKWAKRSLQTLTRWRSR
jgi:hypothetical protein